MTVPSPEATGEGERPSAVRQAFDRFAKRAAALAGRPAAFAIAIGAIIAWLATGPIFAFNDTWQLVINTGTTIVTFLMVFLIQNSQNRDTVALHLKIDELIKTTEGADDRLLDLEELDDKVLEKKRDAFEKLAELARRRGDAGATGGGAA
ncbi:MAG TPA: low affinity iron permease family protein [Acidimicrobiia bacterium]|jgi:low affinity Fe/Cu permease